MPRLFEIGPVVLEKNFEFRQYIFASLVLSPLGQGCGPSFDYTAIHISRGCYVSSLVKIGPVVLEKKTIMSKVYYANDAQLTNFDQKGSLEPLAKVS